MFWRVASGSVSSSVEAILSRDSFTLEQLLAEDELVKVRAPALPRESSFWDHLMLASHRSTVEWYHQGLQHYFCGHQIPSSCTKGTWSALLTQVEREC